MYIPDFKYHKPNSIEEACNILNNCENAAALAGGTDLLVEIKQGLRKHNNIVSLSGIKELSRITFQNGELSIGAAVTHSELAKSEIIKINFPAISEAALKIGSEQVRNSGTIGGNICTAASCCDTAPILIALDAELEIVSKRGTRTLPLSEFFTFHRETIMLNDEIITKVRVPEVKQGTYSSYEKFGLREAASISVASAAVKLVFNNDTCSEASVVIGAVAPTPKISEKASQALIGCKLSDIKKGSETLNNAGKGAVSDSLPIDDIRGTAEYRRSVISVITQRAIINAVNRS